MFSLSIMAAGFPFNLFLAAMYKVLSPQVFGLWNATIFLVFNVIWFIRNQCLLSNSLFHVSYAFVLFGRAIQETNLFHTNCMHNSVADLMVLHRLRLLMENSTSIVNYASASTIKELINLQDKKKKKNLQKTSAGTCVAPTKVFQQSS